MTVIRLCWYEVQVGATIGIARQMEAIRACLKDRHGFEGDGWGARTSEVRRA
jgi:hypothetical protein